MYGEKPIVSVTHENERISIKKQLTLLKMCVTSLLGGPRADLWLKLLTDTRGGRQFLAPVDINTRERKQREQETVSHPEFE